MKATGIVRKIDDLGRLVLPIELRRAMGIDIKDSLEIFTEGDTVVLRKYAPGCCLRERGGREGNFGSAYVPRV